MRAKKKPDSNHGTGRIHSWAGFIPNYVYKVGRLASHTGSDGFPAASMPQHLRGDCGQRVHCFFNHLGFASLAARNEQQNGKPDLDDYPWISGSDNDRNAARLVPDEKHKAERSSLGVGPSCNRHANRAHTWTNRRIRSPW